MLLELAAGRDEPLMSMVGPPLLCVLGLSGPGDGERLLDEPSCCSSGHIPSTPIIQDRTLCVCIV